MRAFSLFCIMLLLCPMNSAATASDELFARLDQNQDGQLAANEIEPARQRLFDRLLRTSDENDDGQLSAEEFQLGLKPTSAEKPLVKKQSSEMPGANALLLLLARMDGNSDGEITAAEVPRQFAQVFNRIEDQLGGESDGVLNRRELTQAAPRLSRIAMTIAQRMDLDVDLELALLSEKQWQAAQKMTGSRSRGDLLANPDRARDFFRQLDANRDGQVSMEEVPDQVAQRFGMLMDRADRNGDDLLSEKELMTVSRMLQARESRAKQANAKKRRPQEVAKAIERMLKRLDTDKDRRVSRKEAPRRMAGRFDRLDSDGSGYLERKEIAALVESLSAMRRPELDTSNRDESMQNPQE